MRGKDERDEHTPGLGHNTRQVQVGGRRNDPRPGEGDHKLMVVDGGGMADHARASVQVEAPYTHSSLEGEVGTCDDAFRKALEAGEGMTTSAVPDAVVDVGTLENAVAHARKKGVHSRCTAAAEVHQTTRQVCRTVV